MNSTRAPAVTEADYTTDAFPVVKMLTALCHYMNLSDALLAQWYVMMRNIITLRPRRNGQHLTDDILKRIFFNGNVWISIKISLKFASKGQINNITASVQTMVWRRPGDKPLSKPMMFN